MTLRLVAVPNTDGELAHDLSRLKDLLVLLQPYEADDRPAPPSLALVALEALQRIRGTVVAAVGRPAPELIGSDGGLELMPVHFAQLDDADLAVVGEAIAALHEALLPGGHLMIVDAIRQGVAGAGVGERPCDLVASFDQAYGLLDVAPDDDTRLLATLVEDHTGRLVLTADQEQAYWRVTGRVLAMFHVADRLARFPDRV
jgi:hypothetical protein